MKIPNWAQNLTLEAILYLQAKGYKAELPDINWRHGSASYSSGHATNKEKITITAGKNRLDQKLVLLHEIAHTATDNEIKYWNIERAKKAGWHFEKEPIEPIIIKQVCHTDKFWDTAWDLYRQFGLPIRYCLNREKGYRKGAVTAYRRNRKSKGL